MSTDISERETQEYLKSLTVLYVEDENDSREQCSEFLSRLVGVLVTAQNGVEGLDAWRQHAPDIVITDVQMPVMDGLSMAEEIRSRDMSVPIIVLTAFDRGEYLLKSINIGIDKYVTKPVDSGRLQLSLFSCARRLLVEKQLKLSQEALERENEEKDERAAELVIANKELAFQNEEKEKRAAELVISEARFRTMANSAPVLIWISGTDKLFTWFNQVWLDFTGRSMEQEHGNGWVEGVHPDDLERCLDTYVTAFDNRQTFSIEYRLRAADGQYRWVIDNGVPTYAENAFTGYIGSCVDITGQKIIEKELFKTTALLTNITNSNPDAIYSKDLDGRYMLFNNAAARFVGKSADEVLGKDDYNLFPPDEADKLMEKDRKSVKEGTCVTFEETITNLSGLEISFLVTKGPLLNQEGEAFGVFGVSRNITERKQTERELAVLRELSLQMAEKRTEEIRRSEIFTNDVIDSMISHIAVLDATGKIIKINKPWKHFAEENCGHHYISDFVGADYLSVCSASIDSDNDQDAAAACDGIRSVLERETEHFWMEYPCHSPIERRWFLMTVSRLYDSQGVVVSHTNITERKQAEEREKETNRKLTRQMAELELANEQLKKMQLALQKSEKTLSGCS